MEDRKITFPDGTKVPASASIAGELITTPINKYAQIALEQWHVEHAEELAELLSPYGLHPFDIVTPAYRRVVRIEEIRP